MEMINAIGRRKASVARVYLTKGNGTVTVNGKDYKEYFPIPHIQADITDPFQTVEIDGNIYDLKVNVKGGGFKGQAQAIRMAISRTREYGADKEGAAICGNPLCRKTAASGELTTP